MLLNQARPVRMANESALPAREGMMAQAASGLEATLRLSVRGISS
ncbi:hypothetical protein [Acetobacter nitrogenifigens]